MIDVFEPPPRWWIDSTISRSPGPRRLGDIALQIVQELRGDNPDDGLAQRILADAPNYLYGENPTNARTHALWALMQLRRDDELSVLLEPLQRVCQLWFRRRIVPPIPAELLLMVTYAWLRLDRVHDAKVAIVLCDRLSLNEQQRDDLTLMTVSIPTEDQPSTASFH